jgi:flagellar hook-basal body complex protein FliE
MRAVEGIPALPPIQELRESSGSARAPGRGGFAEMLHEAIDAVDRLQHDSAAAQAAYARGEPVDLHDVLIRIEEAELAFKTMMEIRNKLVEAYREVMRMGV